MTLRINITIKRAAWHESAHAIVGRVLKFDCGGASITAHGSGSANVATAVSLHWNITDSDIHTSVMKKIIVCCAGGEAERIAFGDANDRGDLRQIKQLQLKYYVSDQVISRRRVLVLASLLFFTGRKSNSSQQHCSQRYGRRSWRCIHPCMARRYCDLALSLSSSRKIGDTLPSLQII
jgi:ATP-dependent Zn protease